jgi:hypothetical protein
MFCPQCGSTQSDDLNYCKACGANLHAVRSALVKGTSPDEKLDWNRTWLAEAVMTRDEKDRRRGLTPEQKRRREIKAGVITLAAGVSLTVVLSVIMEAIVINGRISTLAADILSRVWIVGLIPILVGVALIFNGVFISKKTPDAAIDQTPRLDELPSANTNELPPAQPFASVTDNTTRHLEEPLPVRAKVPKRDQ